MKAKTGWIAILILSFLLGCAPQTKTVVPPRVFSVLYNEKESSPFRADWLILQEYQKLQNVTLNVQVGDDADYNKALTLVFQSKNIPDIVLKVYPDGMENYAATGLLLPVSDYEALLPNFKAYINDHHLEAELDKLRMDNGKYYILPGFRREIQVQQWIYRQDAFVKNNLENPTTYDELFESLLRLKEIYPDSTPITASWGGAHLFAMIGAGYGIPAGWAGVNHYDLTQDRWGYAPATDSFREMLRFLHRCYQAGVLDPDLFTQSVEEYQLKVEDGRALVTVSWITSGFSSTNDKLKENGIADGEWAPLPVPQSTIGIKALPAVDPYRKGLAIPSSVANEPYLEDLLKFLDWAVYSEEGMTLTTWGVEGVTFENTANGKAYLPHIQSPKNPAGTVDMVTEYGLDTIFNLNENEEFEDYKKPAEIVAFLQRSLDANETASLRPALKLNADALEAIRIVSEQITPYADEAMKAFIVGTLDIDDDWETYLAGLEERGYLTLEEIWNSAWIAQQK